MHGKTLFIELLLAGFFALAWFNARIPASAGGLPTLGDFFRMPSRRERLRRSRWQWLTMVALMVVLRLQGELPLGIELMVALDFALFLALPVRASAVSTAVAVTTP